MYNPINFLSPAPQKKSLIRQLLLAYLQLDLYQDAKVQVSIDGHFFILVVQAMKSSQTFGELVCALITYCCPKPSQCNFKNKSNSLDFVTTLRRAFPKETVPKTLVTQYENFVKTKIQRNQTTAKLDSKPFPIPDHCFRSLRRHMPRILKTLKHAETQNRKRQQRRRKQTASLTLFHDIVTGVGGGSHRFHSQGSSTFPCPPPGNVMVCKQTETD